MKFSLLNCFVIIGLLSIAPQANAAVIGFEDFDGGAINLSSTTNVLVYGSGGGSGGDVFGIVSSAAGGGVGGPFDVWDDSVVGNGGDVFESDTLGVGGQFTTAFFAMNDSYANIDGNGGNLNNAVWSFNISGATQPISNIMIDIAAMGDFEAGSSDGFTIQAQIDGGGYQTIFQGITDEDIDAHEYNLMDIGTLVALNDPLKLSIDGLATGIILDKADPTTGLFNTYMSTLFAGQSGSNLDIQIFWSGTPSGGEPMGFDNITVNSGVAIPEPGSFAVLSLIGLAGLAKRRRK